MGTHSSKDAFHEGTKGNAPLLSDFHELLVFHHHIEQERQSFISGSTKKKPQIKKNF